MLSLLWLMFLVYSVLGNVLQLKDADFHTEIAKYPNIMVKFYAPWCGHCKKLAPEYEKAAERLIKLDPPVYLADVDCTTEQKVCKEFGVSGYPTLKTYRNGKDPQDYNKPRTADAIYEHMKVLSLPVVTEFHTINELHTKMEAHKPTVVSYISSKEDSLFKTFTEVASDLHGKAVFLYTSDATLIDNSGKQRPKFLHTKLEDSTVEFDGKLSSADVKEWILRNGYGMVGYLTESNGDFFPLAPRLTLYHSASAESYPKGVIYYRNRMIKGINSANALKSGLTFVYCPLETCQHEADALGYKSEEDLPLVAIQSEGKKFKMDKYSPDVFVDFLRKYNDKELTPYLKSQPIPTSQPDNVLHVVAANFEEIVNDPTKDVFIAFVASWCGHCKSLKPKFESAAGKLKNEPGVLFVSMDAAENDVPSPYSVSGFPTLYFVPKGDKQNPKQFEGNREEDDLIKYVAEMSTDELVGYDRTGKPKKKEEL